MPPEVKRPPLPDGLVAFVKRDCPTCGLVIPVLKGLAEKLAVTVYTQDDPSFPASLQPIDDTGLETSYRHRIEVVPTLLRVEGGLSLIHI